ncbi:peptidoglycan DD-metalloendopeptidase family protein [Frateuria aurantia]
MDVRHRALGFLIVTSLLAGCGIRHRTVVVEPAAQGRAYPAADAGAARGHLSGDHYIVGKGDTLYSIAFRNGLDFRSLAAWNGIADPYRIWPGQSLRLTAPGGAAAPAPVPASGGFETAAAPPPPTPGPVASHPVAVAPPPPPPRPAIPASVTPAVAPPVVAAPAAVVASGASRSSGGITWRWPATGALIKRYQASDPIPGIEIAGKAGDPVRAAADGVVVYSGNGLVGYGELIIIKHSDALLSAYGHNSTRLVKEGQTVKSGQKIAEMGSSGASRVELEFQVRRDGNPVDPMAYLPPQG